MFSFNIAKRFLWNNKAQTLFIILGIAIGVSVQVFVGSLIQGLQKSLIDRTIGSSPHIIINSNSSSERIDDWDAILTELEDIEEITATVLIMDGNGFINNFETNGSGVLRNFTLNTPQVLLLRGFDLAQGNRIFRYNQSLLSGRMPQAQNEVLIGKETQEEYKLVLGDHIDIVKGRPPYDTTYRLTIVGFYDLGVASLNRLWAITQNITVAELFDFNGQVSSINLQVSDVFAADTVAAAIESKIQARIPTVPSLQNITVTNWKAENAQLLSG